MKVKELLSDKSKWIKNVFAKNKEGDEVNYHDPTAYSFCLAGAVRRCYSETEEVFHDISLQISIKTHQDITQWNWSIVQWNDDPERTFEEVKELVEELDI